MGRKKSKRKPPAKKASAKLADVFDCPFCNHEGTCRVTLNREKSVGSIKCSICDEDFQCPINYLSEPIDVYTEWIDACDEANAQTGEGGASGANDYEDGDDGEYVPRDDRADARARTYQEPEEEEDDDSDDGDLVDAAF